MSDTASNPVEPWELSGLLDGELPPARAAQVRAAIDADPALRAEWQTISALSQQWKSAAQSADLPVRVSFANARWFRGAALLAGIVLLLVRFVPKFTAPMVGLIVQGATLALLLACAVVLVNKAEPAVRTASPRPSSRPA